MPYRYFRRLDTGELCTGVVGSAGPFVTSMVAHRQNWADAHGLPIEQIEGFEVEDPSEVPDLSAARNPLPVPTTPDQVERAELETLRFPTPTEIENIVQNTITAAQSGNWNPLTTLLIRIVKLERGLVRRIGL